MTALEPSEGMRKLLQKEALKRNIGFLSIDRRRWEDVLRIEFRDYDLVIACNSLHLTQIAFKDVFEKIFGLRPKNIFLVAESHFSVIPIGSHYEDYTMLFAEYFEAESSFAYHDMKEILEHWVFKNDRYPSYFEQVEIQSKLSFRNGHYWMDDIASVGMFWWKRMQNM